MVSFVNERIIEFLPCDCHSLFESQSVGCLTHFSNICRIEINQYNQAFSLFYEFWNSEYGIQNSEFRIRNCEVVWKCKVNHLGHRRILIQSCTVCSDLSAQKLQCILPLDRCVENGFHPMHGWVSRKLPVSYWRKNVHGMLVNRLSGLSLHKKSVVRLTGRSDVIIDVYRGRKITTTTKATAKLR